jgi:hypothetical protein
MNRLKIAQPPGHEHLPPAVVVIQQPRGGWHNRMYNERRTPAALKAWAVRNGYTLAGTRHRRAA